MVWEELQAEQELCVCVCVWQSTSPEVLKVVITAGGAHTHLYDCCVCDRWPVALTHRLCRISRAVSRCNAACGSAPLSKLSSLGNVIFLTCGTTFGSLRASFEGLRGFCFSSSLIFYPILEKMVRFGRLTSWHSWDLLVIPESAESPVPELRMAQGNCQVRRSLTRYAQMSVVWH